MFESDEKRLFETTRSRAVAAGTIHLLRNASSDFWLELGCAFLASFLLLATLVGIVMGTGPGYSEASACWKAKR